MSPPLERLCVALSDCYRIERELGAGGMATVHLAEDLKHKRRVALKVLKPELAAVLGAERFVQEITTTAALQHPHILPLFDSGEADGFLFYVMPFIDGETLRAKLDRETQLGVDEAVRVARHVADALDYAHRNGVIHRDIKPENILLHEGRPVVADFGIALAVSAAAGGRMTETGLSLGTPHYMSPEQATAEKEISARSDVYSLASVLYEMLTGDPPHTGSSAQQIIMKIITETPRPVTALRKSVPPHVAAAISVALEKLPADRFASAREFSDALSRPGFTAAGSTAHLSTAPLAGAWIRDPRTLATLALAAVVSIGTAVAAARPRPLDGPIEYDLVLTDSAAISPVMGGGFAVSPAGNFVVYQVQREGVIPLTERRHDASHRLDGRGMVASHLARRHTGRLPATPGAGMDRRSRSHRRGPGHHPRPGRRLCHAPLAGGRASPGGRRGRLPHPVVGSGRGSDHFRGGAVLLTAGPAARRYYPALRRRRQQAGISHRPSGREQGGRALDRVQ